MATKKNVLGVTEADHSDGVSTEDYNQIDPGILDCFPPTKFPVNLFHLREQVGMLTQIYTAGKEVDNKSRARFKELSEQGVLFFTRNQIEQYTASVACSLGTALDDPNLTWEEKSGVFIGELKRRQDAVFTHPMPQELEDLRQTIETLCVYLIEDNHRMSKVAQDVHNDLTPERRRINASLMALAIYVEMHKGDILSETLELVTLGFFLYDIGMSKVSHLMIARPNQLTPFEQRSLHEHPVQSLEILKRLNLVRPEIIEPAIQHHERLNGTGYPKKISGDRISKLGRIVAVADSYSAMVTDTAQRKGFSPIGAAAELVKNEKQYDPITCRTLVRFLQTVPS